MGRLITLGAVLYGLWLLLSGYFEPLLLSLGLFSVVLVLFIAWRMDVVDQEGIPVHLTFRALTYLPWLLWQVIVSNVAVMKIIVDPRLPIGPTLVRFRGSQQTDLGRFIFANSITLTPGTITVGVEGELFDVHALRGDFVDGTEEGPMDRRVTRLEGGA